MDDELRIKKKLLDYERRFLEEKDRLKKREISRRYIRYYRDQRAIERRQNFRKKFRADTIAFGTATGLSLGFAFKSLFLIKAGFFIGLFGSDYLLQSRE